MYTNAFILKKFPITPFEKELGCLGTGSLLKKISLPFSKNRFGVQNVGGGKNLLDTLLQ
jgi:hypothetical protein